MSRNKLPKGMLKKFHNIGIREADYKRILEEAKLSKKGIVVIVTEALDEYFCQLVNKRSYQ